MEHSKALGLMGKKISFIYNDETHVGFVVAVLKKWMEKKKFK